MITEDEAKTKWCSVGSAGVATLIATGRTEPQSGFIPKCIGSACMMFRWADDTRILLGNGSEALIDREDADIAGDGWWWSGRYVKNGSGYLHRRVVERMIDDGIPDGIVVDHIDGDTLNNRRGNLRLATQGENAANAKSRGGASQFRGVFRARNGKWAAQISRQGKRHHIGTFETEAAAAEAYDAAAKAMHVEFARLNMAIRKNQGRKGYCGLAGKPE